MLGAAAETEVAVVVVGGVEGVVAGGVGLSTTKDSWIGGGNEIPDEFRLDSP
jgi:hypothetical protein